MATGILERKQYVLHPQGAARFTFSDYEVKPDGTFGPQIVWKFDSNKLMPAKEGSTQRLPFRQHYFSGTEFSPDPRNKLGIVLRALGVNVDDPKFDPKQLDIDALLGNVIESMVVHAPDKQGTMRANLTGLVPYVPDDEQEAPAPKPGRRAAPAAQATLAADEDEYDPFEAE